ncbi:hypothetical protein RJ639_045435 [Escallonia herrerae]|uniref:Cellulose synthase n=1 Tax=Escallonia herrerae TaxID=1293975 RepID=A0AA88WB28_9ASTE|nr:hypothetical protein RJ639_045435 [Escallonia herrerae]
MAVREKEMGKDGYLPLFETKGAKGRIPYWFYAGSMFMGICLICIFRVSHIPAQGDFRRPAWIGMFMAELWFSFFWLITQSVRWNPIRRYTFKERLYQSDAFAREYSEAKVLQMVINRYEKVLPSIDVFVCTADPQVEPPLMVINTVLSLMAYSYPPEKLNVYLSDDGGSDLMFYALLEASRFSTYWLPFCRKLKIEPRSPAAYFATACEPTDDPVMANEWSSIKVCISNYQLVVKIARHINLKLCDS